MLADVRGRYLRLLLPAAAVLLGLGFLLLWCSGFGFRYLLRQPAPLSGLSAGELPGSYVTVPVKDLGKTFASLGHQDEHGNYVVRERYCVYLVEGKYLAVRVPEDYVSLLEQKDEASSLVASGELGSLLELNLGSLRGTVSEKPNQEIMGILRDWLKERQLTQSWDAYSGADLSPWQDETGALDVEGYLDAVILPLQLETEYWGRLPVSTVKGLTLAAALCLLLALALLASLLAGFWERPFRRALRRYGRDALKGDYGEGQVFTARLRVGKQFLWLFRTFGTKLLPLEDVIWAYPRSRRLEGGRQSWSLVLKTLEGEEFALRLGDQATVQQATDCIKSRGFPLSLGFDKEKQKLYQKDLATFKARVVNGTL